MCFKTVLCTFLIHYLFQKPYIIKQCSLKKQISLQSTATEQSIGNGQSFFNVLVSLNILIIDVYAVKMMFCAIQNITKINRILLFDN